jgi:hypothetical protein
MDFFLFQHGVGVSDTRQNILSGNVIVVLGQDFVDGYSLPEKTKYHVDGHPALGNDRLAAVYVVSPLNTNCWNRPIHTKTNPYPYLQCIILPVLEGSFADLDDCARS